MQFFRPNEQRAKNAITLIWIVLILEVLSLISGYLQYDLLQTVAHGGNISMSQADANDLRELFVGILYFIAFIISAVTFIQWFRRAYFNLHLKVRHLKNEESAASYSWFIPFVNLYRPYQIMKETYQETKELLIKNGIQEKQTLSSSNVLIWWTLWIVSGLIGQFTFRFSMHAETIDELTMSTIFNLINNIIGIPLALITIKIIKDYSINESLLFEIKDENEISNI